MGSSGDGDVAALGLLDLGQRELENALLHRRLRLRFVDVRGKRDRAREGATRDLATVEVALLLLLLAARRARQREHIARNRYLDVFLPETGNLGADEDLVVAIDHVHAGDVFGYCARRKAGGPAAAEEFVEQTIHVRERAHDARHPLYGSSQGWQIVSTSCHGHVSLSRQC